jgi:hypothetical protein
MKLCSLHNVSILIEKFCKSVCQIIIRQFGEKSVGYDSQKLVKIIKPSVRYDSQKLVKIIKPSVRKFGKKTAR